VTPIGIWKAIKVQVECQFREVGHWKAYLDDVRVHKGVAFTSVPIGCANLENLTCDYIPRIFHHFKLLRQLLVRNCGSMKINAETFKEATISKFIANENNYPKIEDNTFSGAENLTDLDLKRNKVQEISQRAFAGCRKLRIVDLSENEIRELKTESFGCSTLQNLNLERNKIQQISDGTFLGAENLTVLNLIQNEITKISTDGFKGLTNLQHLRLGHNKLTYLRKEMLEKVESLKSLGLANNQIEVLNADTFQGNPMLSKIDLQHNQLKAIANGTFDSSQQLILEGNFCVKYIDGKWNIRACIVEYNHRNPPTTPSTESTTEHSEAISTTKTRAREHRSFDENPLQVILTKFILSKNYSIADFIFMLILLIFTWKLLSGNDETQNENLRVNQTRPFSHLYEETSVNNVEDNDDMET
jgi:hypothetical protein